MTAEDEQEQPGNHSGDRRSCARTLRKVSRGGAYSREHGESGASVSAQILGAMAIPGVRANRLKARARYGFPLLSVIFDFEVIRPPTCLISYICTVAW